MFRSVLCGIAYQSFRHFAFFMRFPAFFLLLAIRDIFMYYVLQSKQNNWNSGSIDTLNLVESK